MVFPILGANTESAAYEIDNSLRFNDDDSAYLSRTPSSASNRKTWTWSGWVKRGNESLNIMFLSAGSSSGQGVYLADGNTFNLTKSAVGNYGVSALLRDASAWYHLVVAVDTTQTGMSNIAKFYINGVQQTASGTTIYSTNEDTEINNNTAHYVSRWSKSAQYYHDGYLAEVNFIDGQALDASYFGETNDNGVWIPKQYTGSYGTNGFFHEFKQTGTSQNSSGIGADTSGNDNHYAVSNLAATDVTTDTPTNNFATLNSLSDISTSVTFTEGNTKASIGAGSTNRAVGNMGFTSGKWYYEVKYVSTSASASYLEVGFVNTDISMRYHVRGSDGERWDNGSPSSSTSYRHDPGDIIGVYIDADNKKWYIQVNGSNEDVGNGVADVSAGTGFVHQNFAVTDFILPYFANASGSGGHVFEVNFGNAPFSISSGNADANGYGNFEYNPTNDGVDFYALCTKNLAEYG